MSNELIPLKDIERMASIMGQGKLFGKTPQELLPLMLIAQAEGRHPAVVAMEYDIIQGKPALNSRAALARFQSDGGIIEWVTRDDAKAEAKFSHPTKCPKPISIMWDMDRAAKAGIGGKPTWKQYPRQMLSARVIAEGVRACDPACLLGFYTVEEVQDVDYGNGGMKNVTPPKADAAPEPPAVTAPAPAAAVTPGFSDDIPWEMPANIEALRKELSDMLEDTAVPDDIAARGLEWLATPDGKDADKLTKRIEGMKTYMAKKAEATA